jgi:hypothetical protein
MSLGRSLFPCLPLGLPCTFQNREQLLLMKFFANKTEGILLLPLHFDDTYIMSHSGWDNHYRTTSDGCKTES